MNGQNVLCGKRLRLLGDTGDFVLIFHGNGAGLALA
jgi:hypothetical protein